MVNFVLSPNDTMEFPEKLKYTKGSDERFNVADNLCCVDGFIFFSSKADNTMNPPTRCVVKVFDLKRPFIRRDVVNFPNVVDSKKFICQVAEYCLATGTKSA
ncbi:unnamed protein product [Ambrosiozyma monospora]|uniref:Unnamed protein product n=1 Tax=Ambrosiozyma monospora TaxID=43982 RepID=A0ACB5SXR8_AMBMO|nr:unnamed protein product [Ambrosiozyma monospora]